MANEPPVCRKCGLSHWRFQSCDHGKKIVARNYAMVKRPSAYPSSYGLQRGETQYQRQQFRESPRITYQGDEPPEAA